MRGSPVIAVVVDDQVVGAAGFFPTITDFIWDQPEFPLLFTALTLKKYSSPDSSPVFS